MNSSPPPPAPTTSTPLRHRERGASEMFMLILMTTMLAFAGLAYDAGMAFNARRQATNVASAAARVGANQVETDSLYLTGLPALDRSRATSAARNRVQLAGLTVVEAKVENLMQVRVKVQAVHRTTFLGIIGIDTLTVEGEARAMAESLARG